MHIRSLLITARHARALVLYAYQVPMPKYHHASTQVPRENVIRDRTTLKYMQATCRYDPTTFTTKTVRVLTKTENSKKLSWRTHIDSTFLAKAYDQKVTQTVRCAVCQKVTQRFDRQWVKKVSQGFDTVVKLSGAILGMKKHQENCQDVIRDYKLDLNHWKKSPHQGLTTTFEYLHGGESHKISQQWLFQVIIPYHTAPQADQTTPHAKGRI